MLTFILIVNQKKRKHELVTNPLVGHQRLPVSLPSCFLVLSEVIIGSRYSARVYFPSFTQEVRAVVSELEGFQFDPPPWLCRSVPLQDT